MADAGAEGETAPRKPKRRGLAAGAALALILGGGGFYAAWSGLIPSGGAEDHAAAGPAADAAAPLADLPPVAFVAMEPLLISLGPGAGADHLRFQAQLEVAPGHEAGVTALLPRVIDVLNSYLRAVDPSELEDPAALTRLRAQMLRRAQIVVGDDRVRDLLIMEFVLS